MGFTHISEDSSEIAFLLVENYNHDHSWWTPVCQGIFGLTSLLRLSLFIAVAFGCHEEDWRLDYGD